MTHQKNKNKVNNTIIIENRNLKTEKKEYKIPSPIKKPSLNNNLNISKSSTQLKDSLIILKKELKEKEDLNNNLQNKKKENENIIKNLNNQIFDIKVNQPKRRQNDLFDMDNLMERLSTMENVKSEQDKKIKLLTEQIKNILLILEKVFL